MISCHLRKDLSKASVAGLPRGKERRRLLEGGVSDCRRRQEVTGVGVVAV